MSSDAYTVRDQVLANARFLLVAPTTTEGLATSTESHNVVVFGLNGRFTGAVLVGTIPAIEGPEATTPDMAVRRLLTTTCELMAMYIPKLGSHQRNVHGGGVFDEDLIKPDIGLA